MNYIDELTLKYQDQWHDRNPLYWWWRLLQEVIELLGAILGIHKDPVDHEIAQVASIATNFYRRFSLQRVEIMDESTQYYLIEGNLYEECHAHSVEPEDLSNGDLVVIKQGGRFRKNREGGYIYRTQRVDEHPNYGAEVFVEAYDGRDEDVFENVTVLDEHSIRKWEQFEGVGRRIAENAVATLGDLGNMRREDWESLQEVSGIGPELEQSILQRVAKAGYWEENGEVPSNLKTKEVAA